MKARSKEGMENRDVCGWKMGYPPLLTHAWKKLPKYPLAIWKVNNNSKRKYHENFSRYTGRAKINPNYLLEIFIPNA